MRVTLDLIFASERYLEYHASAANLHSDGIELLLVALARDLVEHVHVVINLGDVGRGQLLVHVVNVGLLVLDVGGVRRCGAVAVAALLGTRLVGRLGAPFLVAPAARAAPRGAAQLDEELFQLARAARVYVLAFVDDIQRHLCEVLTLKRLDLDAPLLRLGLEHLELTAALVHLEQLHFVVNHQRLLLIVQLDRALPHALFLSGHSWLAVACCVSVRAE